MPIPRLLKNAPITEGLVDIRVKLPPNRDLSDLDSKYYSKVSENYPQRRERLRIEAEFDLKKGEAVRRTKFVDGYMYTSKDGKQIVQARLDGFTFSRLKPYQSWERLHEDSHPLWDLYVKVASPEVVTRVALRYINRLDIPLPIRDFSDYLNAPPTIPPGLHQELSRFLTRILIYDPNFDASAIITQSLEPLRDTTLEILRDTKTVPIILDIDVFKEVEFSMADERTWNIISRLRDLKNKIFFESVTEKALELWQ
jgi:uncharacterized protein (TIGR04255 family)